MLKLQKCEFSAFYSLFWATSAQMTSLSGLLRSLPAAISSYMIAPPASYTTVGSKMHPKSEILAFHSVFQPTLHEMMTLSGHFSVTCGRHHFLSHE